MDSKEYRKFKRDFVGPILPRKIGRQRRIGIYSKDPMCADKPKKNYLLKKSTSTLRLGA